MKYLDLIDSLWPEWHAQAACHPDKGHDPQLWFPTTPAGWKRESGAARERIIQPAVRICNGCPVRHQCLSDAIERGERFGIHGGVDFEGKWANDDAA